MRNITLGLTIIGAFFIIACNSQTKVEQVDYISKSKPIAQSFGQTLKSELNDAISIEGPAGAIEVCKSVSKMMEDDYTEKHPEIIRLRRVSLKTRNPETHTPTEKEREWLIQQEEIVASNQQPQPGVIHGRDEVTVLFPIVIDNPLCLVCHGDIQHMPDDFKETLNRNYPNDNATGYQLGDFRGAIAIEWDV